MGDQKGVELGNKDTVLAYVVKLSIRPGPRLFTDAPALAHFDRPARLGVLRTLFCLMSGFFEETAMPLGLAC